MLGRIDTPSVNFKPFIKLITAIVLLTSCGGENDQQASQPPTVVNISPIANAGDDKAAFEGSQVQLSGSGTDNDGSISSYRWTIEGNNAISLEGANHASASFVAPETDQVLDLQATLTVTDNRGDSHSDSVRVRILPAATAAWEPSRISDCQTNANLSPNSIKVADTLVATNERMWEPSIIFSDETTTFYTRLPAGPASVVTDVLIDSRIAALDDDDSNLVFDDGTHGDLVAGDGIFTRACLYSPAHWFDEKDTIGFSNLFVVKQDFRGTEQVTEISPGVRINDTGFFISLGDEYQLRYSNSWQLHSPESCKACAIAWGLAGDIFDFFSVATRDPHGGAGYVRVHDHIKGTGFAPPCNDNAYCYRIVDGEAHLKLTGIIWNGWPGLEGFNHEIGHGLLGLGTQDFPSSGKGAWNSDRMHLDSDTTVNGELSGPFWDPDRGWPYAVVLEDALGQQSETYLVRDTDGQFRMKPMDDQFRVWSDILLYMMGLIDASDSSETYYKLVDISLSGCIPEGYRLLCRNDLVTAQQVIPFSIADLVARYGAWSAPDFYDPQKLTIGVLNISDREHTNAEIVWLSRINREFAATDFTESPWFRGTPWHKATRGLSKVDIDALKFTQTSP